MNRWEKGANTEKRAFRALSELAKMHPDIVLSFEQTSVEFDVRGIDAFVTISLPHASEPSRLVIPMEFKSSIEGVRIWREENPELDASGVLIFHLPQKMSPRATRRLIFRAIERVRKHPRHYVEMYRYVHSRLREWRPGIGRLIRLVRLQRAERRQ